MADALTTKQLSRAGFTLLMYIFPMWHRPTLGLRRSPGLHGGGGRAVGVFAFLGEVTDPSPGRVRGLGSGALEIRI